MNLVTALRELATLAPDLRVSYVALSTHNGTAYAAVQCVSEAALHDLWDALAMSADAITPILPQEFEGCHWHAGAVTIGALEIRVSWHLPANAATHVRHEHAQEIAP